MNFNMTLPGLKDVELMKMEETTRGVHLHIQMPRKLHQCPVCGEWTEHRDF